MRDVRSMDELIPLIRAAVEAGGEFPLVTRGTSMLPLLRNGVDTAVLAAAPAALKKGDVPLYRRADGAFVLHRVESVGSDGTFSARGDNQLVIERNIPLSSVEAVMTAVVRDGKRTSLSSPEMRRYRRLLPLRRLRLRAAIFLRRRKKT